MFTWKPGVFLKGRFIQNKPTANESIATSGAGHLNISYVLLSTVVRA